MPNDPGQEIAPAQNRITAPTRDQLYEYLGRHVPNMLSLLNAHDAGSNERGCWIWSGAPSSRMGYGQISIGPRRDRLIISAHRMSYMIHRGDPGPLHTLHSCDNPLCFNPEHLFLGTAGDNIRDCVAKGRHRNQNTGRTHCRRGHPLIASNVRLEGGRFRRCLTCQRESH